jgi:putative transposase
MRKSRYTEERIIRVLRQAEQGEKVKDVVREYGISEQTYYRWKSKYGGTDVSEARRLKELEIENRRLKKLVADLSLDKQILNDALGRKG